MIVRDTQRFMAEQMRARVRSHPVDHAPIITAAGLVVDIIREAIGEAIRGDEPDLAVSGLNESRVLRPCPPRKTYT